MSGKARYHWLAWAGVALVLLMFGLHDVAQARSNPFGAGHGTMPSGVVGYLLFKQAQFYREMTGLIRAAKNDGSAAVALFGIAFLYGVFHAAGPGHGKAVISSYMVANRETWRRGVILSFAAALVQALSAIVLVGIAAVLLNATARTMNSTVHLIEIAAYAMVLALGLRLLWTKGLALARALRDRRRDSRDPIADAPVAHALSAQAVPPSTRNGPADHDHACCMHGHGHSADAHHDQVHVHGSAAHAGHCDDEACGHAHGPEPAELAGPSGWRRGTAAVLACGLRPCSGAIIVLVFALSQGLLWAGIGATLMMGLGTAITVTAIATLAVAARNLAERLAHSRSSKGLVFLRLVEVAAALVIVCFGVLLLTGYLVEERMLGA